MVTDDILSEKREREKDRKRKGKVWEKESERSIH